MQVGSVLVDILVVLVAAKVAAELSVRAGIPTVVGEIVAGVLIGPSLFGIVHESEALEVLAELGVILLLVEVGMNMEVSDLVSVGRSALSVAAVGVVLPFLAGFAVSSALGVPTVPALFVGASLTATSVGITARVFGDLRALASKEARTVLGAAVADDVIGLVILTVMTGVVAGGALSLGPVAIVLGTAVVFLAAATFAGIRFAPGLIDSVTRVTRTDGTLVALSLSFILIVATLADAARLAPVVGAFVAGLALARYRRADVVRSELAPVGHLLIPVFFLQIGINANVSEFLTTDAMGFAAALLLVAVVGKVLAGLAASRTSGDRLLVGLGMLPRGEVGLIFAGLGLREGVLGDPQYAALLFVVLATTLGAPPLLRWRLGVLRAGSRSIQPIATTGSRDWLRVDSGVVDLSSVPPDHMGLKVAFRAALLLAESSARPGPGLLDWLGALDTRGVRWDADATDLFFSHLRSGDARSWRFLEIAGILESTLPELADAVRARHRDATELDPSAAFRWPLMERIHHLIQTDEAARREFDRLTKPDSLFLAALLIGALGAEETAVRDARRLAKRFDLGAAREQELALLVGESHLLNAAARRPHGLDEEPVLQIALHIKEAATARALYLLALASDPGEPWERARIEQLHDLVQEILRHPGATDRGATNLIERRRQAAFDLVRDEPHVLAWVRSAPRHILIHQEPEAIARQARLLDALRGFDLARFSVETIDGAPDRWRIEVALRDRPALLAYTTGVLADSGLDVLEAFVDEWAEGFGVQSFQVHGTHPPDPTELEQALIVESKGSITSAPIPDAEVSFDNDASPWYSLCQVGAADRERLLHFLSVAIASCGANVRSAVVTTTAGRAVDRFELNTGDGRKLTEPQQEQMRNAISRGVEPRYFGPVGAFRSRIRKLLPSRGVHAIT